MRLWDLLYWIVLLCIQLGKVPHRLVGERGLQHICENGEGKS